MFLFKLVHYFRSIAVSVGVSQYVESPLFLCISGSVYVLKMTACETLRMSAAASSSRLLMSSASSKLWAVSKLCQRCKCCATSGLPSRLLESPDRSFSLCLWTRSWSRTNSGKVNKCVFTVSVYNGLRRGWSKSLNVQALLTMSEMSSRLFLISPQRMALFSWFSASSSLCLTITTSCWAVSWSCAVCSAGRMLPLVERGQPYRSKTQKLELLWKAELAASFHVKSLNTAFQVFLFLY